MPGYSALDLPSAFEAASLRCSGCNGVQIDGTRFSRIVVFRVKH